MGITEPKKMLFQWESKKYIHFGQAGLVLICLGLIIWEFMTIFDHSDRAIINKTIELFFILAKMIFYVGIMLLSLSMFSISVNDENMHIYLRVVLIIATAWIVITFIGNDGSILRYFS